MGYRMLKETAIVDIVSWGPKGDCFVVMDINEFTKSVLPRVFKHSYFAHFVQQLHEHGFHKMEDPRSQSDKGVRLPRSPTPEPQECTNPSLFRVGYSGTLNSKRAGPIH